MVRGMKNLVLILAFLGLVACGDDSANDGSASNNGDPDVARDAGDDVGQDTDAPEADTPEGDVPADTPDPELPPMPWSVDEPGHYAVGYTTGELTYQAEGIGERTLRMSYWYPTFDEVGGGQYQIYARPEVHQDAIPAFTQPLPVLIFSHGSTSFAEQSFFMTEYFASHGFIVAAPDHTGNLYTDRAIPPETFEFRPLDIIAVLDHIQSLPDDHLLHGAFSDDIVMSGHSFGGYTTLANAGSGFAVDTIVAACADGGVGNFCDRLEVDGVEERFRAGFGDPRIKAAIPQAPFGGPVFQDGIADIDIPVLLLTGRVDRTLPPEQDGDPIWAALDGDSDLRVDFHTAGHFTFSNACEIAPGLIGEGDGCGPSFIGPERAFQAINAYSLAFTRFHVLGEDTDLDLLMGERDFGGDIELFSK
jgi:predicted dienelactone hydrolase